MSCAQCGADYGASGATCADRFAELLALDHSHQEPWGSRHGLAFAAYALQHPQDQPFPVRAGCWFLLYRVYVHGVDPAHMVRVMRAHDGGLPPDFTMPPLPAAENAAGPFAVTIADLGDFAADAYPAQLDAWCRATLVAFGAVLPTAR
jgi:hypothetical protein